MSVQSLRRDLASLLEPERRVGPRLPVELHLTAYVDDEPRRGLTTNLSEQGLFLLTLPGPAMPPFTPIGLEIELPGIQETIWAAAEVCFDVEDDYFLGQGMRFVAMARLHARLIRHFCAQLAAGPGGRPGMMAL
jgi:hypothetical protein